MRQRRWMMAVWACCLARLLFYSAVLPLWEGYDEWAHFAVVRQMALGGQILGSRDAPIPRDVEASLQLAPVPWELRSLPPPAVTEDRYWQLPAADRLERQAQLRSMPPEWARQPGTGSLRAYEALQPPLYYWIVTPVLWIFRGAGLPAQVLALRFVSCALASLAVPLIFAIAWEVWRDSNLALTCSAILALMPEFGFDVARVGNDCLAVILFTLLTWLLLRSAPPLAIGFVLGLGLLTKAYFLTAIPAVFLILWAAAHFRAVGLRRAGAAFLAAAGVSGWWYWRNLQTTGTLSGLSESVALKGAGAGEMIRGVMEIPWLKAIDSILLSHLYFGGWSSLTVRSWMYHVFYALIAVAAAGILRASRQSSTRILLVVYACFWIGQCYNVVILYLSKGLAGSMGWYMYAVAGAETVLCLAGLRAIGGGYWRRWIGFAGAGLFALLDVYAMHAVALPYYSGAIRHRAGGGLQAVHWSGLGDIIAAVPRLATLIPPVWMAGFWLLYLVGTGGLLMVTWRGCVGGKAGMARALRDSPGS